MVCLPGIARCFHLRTGLRISLCVATLFCGAIARSQTTDDVHVVPRNGPDQTAALSPLAADERGLLLPHAAALHVDVDRVLVPVTVTDSRNHPVLGLERQHFSVFEDNRRQDLRDFSAEDAPISVGLVLDLSGSMGNKFVIEREAVEQFFRNANSQDDYCVVTFADKPRVLATSTQSIEDIEQKLAATKPDGHTALLDAIYLAVTRLHSARYERKAILIISDGGDNHSRYGLGEIKSLLQESGVEVYAIGIFDTALFKSFEEFMGKRWLGEITDPTGGRTVAATSLEKVPEIAAAISREVRNQYVLAYRPSNQARNGKWRKIKVQVTPPPPVVHVQAYYKKRYLAPNR
ncbi:MAG: VWA domain-containing protein [Acidobacteriia bacterium]|nr:VWA domain-containing protein [Terriglobia bacterium]